MTRFPRIFLTIPGILLALSFASPVCAQTDTLHTRLVWRYDSLMKAQTDAARTPIENGIATERAAIRKDIEKSLASITKIEEGADIGRAVDAQRAILATITERIDGAKADLTLLNKEEGFYKDGTTPPADQIALTKTYPELLAKKAVLEDRLDVLQAIQKAQEDRLSELQREQQTRNLATLLGILTYVAVFLVVFWGEHFISSTILSRIRSRRLRYVFTKTFSFVVYIALIFWFFQKVFSEHPEVFTILAVIGAALVFVLQDIIKSVVAWLGSKNIISLGQRVTIGTMTGDIVDIGLLYTTLLISQPTSAENVSQVGKIVRIPNEKLLSQMVVNYHATSDFENVELPIHIARAAQWDQAQHILEGILKEETEIFSRQAQRQADRRMRGFAIAREAPVSRLHVELTPAGEVMFRLCFPAPIGQSREIASAVTQKILRSFTETGIFGSPNPEEQSAV
ncbi:MAG: mechanosensitive ion channel [Candidatus Peribacteraceae bacterium]|nr:mechanosensitive ion channel [Candidatus Peribacteraceae bacterium]